MLSFTFLYASVWRRAFAALIDLIIVAAFGAIILDPVITVLGLRLASEAHKHAPEAVTILRAYGVWGALTLIAAWLYFAYLESSRWQATIGKRILGLLVFTTDEGRLSFQEASKRFWMKMLSALSLCLGFLLAFRDLKRRMLHDRLSNSLVLQPRTNLQSYFPLPETGRTIAGKS